MKSTIRISVLILLSISFIFSSCTSRRYGNRTIFVWNKSANHQKAHEKKARAEALNLVIPQPVIKGKVDVQSLETDERAHYPEQVAPRHLRVVSNVQEEIDKKESGMTHVISPGFLTKKIGKKALKLIPRPAKGDDGAISNLIYWILVVILILLILTLIREILGPFYGIFILIVLIALLGHILGLW